MDGDSSHLSDCANQTCRCLEAPRCFENAERKHLGWDRNYADVVLYRCKDCGRYWLYYFYEHEAFTSSGRWFQGLITEEQASTMHADIALSTLAKLPWYFYGGSWFGGESGKRSGPLGRMPY